MKFYFDWRKLTRTFTHLINSWYEREIGETNLKSHAWSKRWSFECILMVFFPQKNGDSKRSWNPNLSWYMIYCPCKDTHYSIGVSTILQSFFLKPSTKDRHFKHGQSAWNTWHPQRGGEKAWFHMGHADIWVVSSNRGVDISKISWWRFGWDSLTESWWTCGGLVLSFLESVCGSFALRAFCESKLCPNRIHLIFLPPKM